MVVVMPNSLVFVSRLPRADGYILTDLNARAPRLNQVSQILCLNISFKVGDPYIQIPFRAVHGLFVQPLGVRGVRLPLRINPIYIGMKQKHKGVTKRIVRAYIGVVTVYAIVESLQPVFPCAI